MHHYTSKDFKGCLFNPLEENILNAYPSLQQILGTSDVRMMRYMFALYDPASPLGKDYPEWDIRKKMAATVAGYDLEGESMVVYKDKEMPEGEYLKWAIFDCQDEEFVEASNAFLRKCVRSRTWGMIISNLETFWEYQKRMMIPITKSITDKDKDMMSAVMVKSKLSEDMQIISNRIDALTKELYGGDEQLIDKNDVITSFDPQSVAKAMNKR